MCAMGLRRHGDKEDETGAGTAEEIMRDMQTALNQEQSKIGYGKRQPEPAYDQGKPIAPQNQELAHMHCPPAKTRAGAPRTD